jgi:plastocyanin
MSNLFAGVMLGALALGALVMAPPSPATTTAVTIHASRTTVFSGKALTLSGTITPKLATAAKLTIQWSHDGTSFTALKTLSLAKGAAAYSTTWTAGTKLGPVWFRAKLGTVVSGKVKVLVLAKANVTIANFKFTPKTLTVKRWTRVTWTNNQSGVSHTVTSVNSLSLSATPTGLFDGGPLSTGQTFHFTFTKVGTFFYECKIHKMLASMHAEVVVQ